jgi:hypothetical protein
MAPAAWLSRRARRRTSGRRSELVQALAEPQLGTQPTSRICRFRTCRSLPLTSIDRRSTHWPSSCANLALEFELIDDLRTGIRRLRRPGGHSAHTRARKRHPPERSLERFSEIGVGSIGGVNRAAAFVSGCGFYTRRPSLVDDAGDLASAHIAPSASVR